eukprot:1145836-Pelagomonas_calceolata.AAC.12
MAYLFAAIKARSAGACPATLEARMICAQAGKVPACGSDAPPVAPFLSSPSEVEKSTRLLPALLSLEHQHEQCQDVWGRAEPTSAADDHRRPVWNKQSFHESNKKNRFDVRKRQGISLNPRSAPVGRSTTQRRRTR